MNQKKAKIKKLDRAIPSTLRSWEAPQGKKAAGMGSDVVVDCGWGKLIFAHTFKSIKKLAKAIPNEKENQRNIAFYIRDPHVVIAEAPQDLFLNPSHSYRIWFDEYKKDKIKKRLFMIRKAKTLKDTRNINKTYASRDMVKISPNFFLKNKNSRTLNFFVIEDLKTKEVIGSAVGVDHKLAFNDPENGCSLWGLAIDPQASLPGVGEYLVRYIIEFFMERGRSFLDLSVMHDNKPAIKLYEKLGFKRVPVFCVKHKSSINEKLFSSPLIEKKLKKYNPYSKIIIDEARRRGIRVSPIDRYHNYFSLSFGGNTIICHESLTEATNAIAMSRCSDKRITNRVLKKNDIKVPRQILARSKRIKYFLKTHKSFVAKPRHGEKGKGVFVDIKNSELKKAIETVSGYPGGGIVEEYVQGIDLSIVVIDSKTVAVSIKKPAAIKGNGKLTIKELIEKQSRRRKAATGGESSIPIDNETKRCVHNAGKKMSDVLRKGVSLTVRKSANLNTGGTMHDVTEDVNPNLKKIAEKVANILNIPVVGVDFIVPDIKSDRYIVIEANQRPGLANHEPQPTAERFIDFLFPQSVGNLSKKKQ